MKIKKSPIFYRYLASYVVILLVPSLVLGMYGYDQMVKVINEEVTVNNQERLAQLRDQVDAKLVQMNKIAGQISTNPDLTPYALNVNFYHAYEAKSLLNYKMANEFLQEVLLYIRGGDYLYSSVSTYKTSLFINNIYQYQNWSEDLFYKDINSLTKAQFRPADNVSQLNNDNNKMVTYIVPIPLNSQDPYGTVLYMIPERSLLNYDYTSRNGNTIILNEHNQVIASLKDEAYLEQADFYQAVAGTDGQDSRIMTLEGLEYVVLTIGSNLTGWSYITLLPMSEVLEPVREVGKKWLQILMIILLIGSAIIYVVMHFNYNPIRQLGHWAANRWDTNVTMINELDTVRSIIEHMGQSNQALGHKLLNNQSAIKDSLLLSLLKGEFSHISEFNEGGKDVGLTFTNRYFFAILFDLSKHQEPAFKQNVIEAVEEHLSESMQGYSKRSLEDHRLIYILSSSVEGEELERWVQEVHSSIYNKYKITVTVGVGNVYQNINQIGRSYLEASTAVDFKLIKGNNKIIFFHEVLSEDTVAMSYPTQLMEQLELQIRQGNAEKITEVLIDISDKIKNNSTTLIEARCLCFDVINTVMKAMVDIYAVNPDAKHHFPNALYLMQFDTVEELAEVVTVACIDLCEVIRQQKEGLDEPLMTSLILYMEQNYQDPDFSVQNMADYFSVSLSYLSRYVKQQTGRNVTDYINQLRISHAKRMLVDEEVSLKEIVQQIGYYDVSSFIRKFKKSVGATPGEYKKLYKK